MAVRNPVIDEGHFAYDVATHEASVGYNNQTWSALTKIGVPEAPMDNKPYFMINGQWVAANNVFVDGMPEITSAETASAVLGDTFTYQITATVDDEPASGVTYGISNAPSGMTVNSSTGVVTWPVPTTAATVGSNTFVATVTTQEGAVASQMVTIAVTAPAAFQPSITPNQTVVVAVNEAMEPYQIQGTNITPTTE